MDTEQDKYKDLEKSSFGIFTDDRKTFNELQSLQSVDLSLYHYGIAKASGDPERPYTCVNGTSNTNWKYFISLYVTPFHFFN